MYRMWRQAIRIEKTSGAENVLALRLLVRASVGQLTFEFVQRIDV